MFPTDREGRQSGRSNRHLTLGRRMKSVFQSGLIHGIFMQKLELKTEEIDDSKTALLAPKLWFCESPGLRVKKRLSCAMCFVR